MPVASTDPSSSVRAIAVGAGARGWLDAGAAFDAGVRAAALGPNASAREVLGSTLTEAQLDALDSPRGASEMETMAGPASAPTSSVDGPGFPKREARSTRYVPGALLGEGEPPPGTPRDHSMVRSSRGGSWFALTSWCRGASRLRYASLYRSAYRGLRIARSLAPRPKT